MKKPKTYKNPPLTEAVCEFRFELAGLIAQNQVDSFSEKIKNFFPLKDKGKIHSLQLKIEPDKKREVLENSVKQDSREFDQYFSDDKKWCVRFDGVLLSIHRLKPYTSWGDFFPLIEMVFKSYVETFLPKKILRIGLRYINKIEIPSKSFNFEDYFNIKVSLPSLVQKDQRSIFIGSVFDQENGRDVLKVQFVEKQIADTQSSKVFILDFDYFLLVPGTIDFPKVGNWLHVAHNNLEKVFEGIVLEKTKALFDK